MVLGSVKEILMKGSDAQTSLPACQPVLGPQHPALTGLKIATVGCHGDRLHYASFRVTRVKSVMQLLDQALTVTMPLADI